MAKYEYATRDADKVERAKDTLRQQAGRKGEEIAGFHVFRSSVYPKLQEHDATRGQEFTIILGFTTRRELEVSLKSNSTSPKRPMPTGSLSWRISRSTPAVSRVSRSGYRTR